MTMLADPFAGTPYANRIAVRDSSVAWMTLMGIPQQNDGIDKYQNLEDFAQAPADEAWVFACVQRIFNATQSVPLRVYVKVGKDLVPSADEPSQEGDDLQYLLDNANPVDMSGSELRAYCSASRKIWGGWYLKRVRGRFGGATQELYWLRVPDVKPHSTDGRTVDYYEYRPKNGPQEVIQPRDMIRKRGLNMQSQIDMVSPLSAARYHMVVGQAAPQHTAAVLKNRGVPEGYWKAADGAEITRTDQSAIRRFIRQLKGPKNAGKSLIAPDLEYKVLSLPPKDAEWLAAGRESRMAVCADLGVPLALVGDVANAGFYRSTIDAERVFWKDTMVAELDGDADALNNWLTPEFRRPGGKYLVIAHDYSGVEALKPAWTDEWNGWLNAIDRQAITPNRFIQHFRLGADVPWGDQPTPKTQIALRPDPATIDVNLPVESGEDASTPASPEVIEPGGAPGDYADLPASLRSIGSRLYKQAAVRAFVAHGGPLDAESLIGGRVSDADRRQIEDGLRRRLSAEQIASRFGDTAPAESDTDIALRTLREEVAALRAREPIQVNVNPAPITVHPPAITVESPTVTVNPAPVTIARGAVQVTNSPSAVRRRVERNGAHEIVAVVEEPV